MNTPFILVSILISYFVARQLFPFLSQTGGGTNVTSVVKKSYPIPSPTTELLHKEIPQNLASVIVEDDGDLITVLPNRRYKNPRHMNRLQVLKYKRIGNKSRMTMRDYVDWLRLFKNDTQHLNLVDQNNLKIILRGGQLRPSDREVGPVTVSALTQYNQKIDGNEILPATYDFGRIYKDYDFQTQAKNSYQNVLDIMKPLLSTRRPSHIK